MFLVGVKVVSAIIRMTVCVARIQLFSSFASLRGCMVNAVGPATGLVLMLSQVVILCGTNWAVTPAVTRTQRRSGHWFWWACCTRVVVSVAARSRSCRVTGLNICWCTHLTWASWEPGFGLVIAGQLDSDIGEGATDLVPLRWRGRLILDPVGWRGANWVVVTPGS